MRHDVGGTEPTRAERLNELHHTLTWLESEIYETTEAIRWKEHDLHMLRDRHVRLIAERAAALRAIAALTETRRHGGG